MKTASIVIIGNEILTGRTVDTNSSYLGEKLLSSGIPVRSVHICRDDIECIVSCLDFAFVESDLVLVAGGLGPTGDDLTREACARFAGVELEFDANLLGEIESFFARRELQMRSSCRKQSYLPAGASAIRNEMGTAPGFKLNKGDKLLIVMPGVPDEMRFMFEKYILKELDEFRGSQAVTVRKLHCFGEGESGINERLPGLLDQKRNPQISCTAHCGVITLTITANAEVKHQAEEMALECEQQLRERLCPLVFGSGSETLEAVVGTELARQKKSVALAESCTGGSLAKMLTAVPGASRYFTHGWITYGNEAKIHELGVPDELIAEHGAVSEQVAFLMAEGAAQRSGADFAVGITGIAGPGVDSEEKPVGLVYICVKGPEGVETRRFIFGGGRKKVRARAANTALNILWQRLKH